MTNNYARAGNNTAYNNNVSNKIAVVSQALRAAKRSTISNQFANNQNGELKFNPSTDTATVLNGGPQNTNAFEKKFFEVNSIYFQFQLLCYVFFDIQSSFQEVNIVINFSLDEETDGYIIPASFDQHQKLFESFNS